MKKNEALISDLVVKTVESFGREILADPRYLRLKAYVQHADVSVYDHCLSVACLSVRFVFRHHLKVDLRALVRGALLHDYFLYDWHKPHPEYGLHGYTHPRTAMKNAKRDFQIGKKEANIILRHMFPLTLIPPRYLESWIVNIADDVATCQECHHQHVMVKEKERILQRPQPAEA